MAYIEKVPKHAAKHQLPGLKVGDLVKTRKADYWQNEKTLSQGPLPAGSLGRIKKIFDFGAQADGSGRFYCSIKFEGKGIPLTTFYTEELLKVKV